MTNENRSLFFDGQWWRTDRLSQLHPLPESVTCRAEAKEAAGEMEGKS